MQEITSLQNPLVKEITALHQKKNRTESGLFLIEGVKGIEDAIKYGLEIKYIFVNKESKINFLTKISEEKIFLTDEKVLKKISTTENPPQVAAVAVQKNFVFKDLFKEEKPLIIVLENIKDAGNLGTIIRTAKAANVSGIILTGDCIDLYNPKVVRSSAGNLWKIPVIYFAEKANLHKEFEKYGKFRFLATVVRDEYNCHSELVSESVSYNEIDYKKPTVVFFGSEAEGISDILANQADTFIKIPMNEEVESLNLSISVGLVAYEAFMQRK